MDSGGIEAHWIMNRALMESCLDEWIGGAYGLYYMYLRFPSDQTFLDAYMTPSDQAFLEANEGLLHWQSHADLLFQQLSIAKDRADCREEDWEEEHQRLLGCNEIQETQIRVRT